MSHFGRHTFVSTQMIPTGWGPDQLTVWSVSKISQKHRSTTPYPWCSTRALYAIYNFTQVCFHPDNADRLATGSTDGLVCIFDISQTSEDDALSLVLNSCSTVVCMFTVTTLSFWTDRSLQTA